MKSLRIIQNEIISALKGSGLIGKLAWQTRIKQGEGNFEMFFFPKLASLWSSHVQLERNANWEQSLRE